MNTLQVLVNQFLGVFIFLLLSRYLEKDSYGELNWSLAVLTFIIGILSLRLEQIIVRNVAAGQDASAMLTLFLLHNVVVGTCFFAALLLIRRLAPVFFIHHPVLWLLSISQLLGFFAVPFRQLATGRSAFGWLALLSTLSNAIRCIGLIWLTSFSSVTLVKVLLLFTVSAGVEFLAGIYIVVCRMGIRLDIRQRSTDYARLIKDSLPQAGLVFLQAGLARIDWILMGIFSTAAHTGEYSFAYRAYEFSPLPLLVLAPFLLNSFSKYFREGGDGPEATVTGAYGAERGRGEKRSGPPWLNGFVRLEMIFATLLPLWGVLLWTPLVDYFTFHKYGQVNAFTFLLLSCSVPFQYLVNIYWTAEFARNRLSHILFITAITCGVVLVGDGVLIPWLGGPGASIAWLLAMLVQYLLYSRTSFLPEAREWERILLLAICITVIAGSAAVWLTPSLPWRLIIGTGVYGLLCWGTGRFRYKEFFQLPVFPTPEKLYGK